MRKVIVSYFEYSNTKREYFWVEKGVATFHEFTSQSDAGDLMAGGIVEWPNGACEWIPVNGLRFVSEGDHP
jgi:hypothetical protein